MSDFKHVDGKKKEIFAAECAKAIIPINCLKMMNHHGLPAVDLNIEGQICKLSCNYEIISVSHQACGAGIALKPNMAADF